jgi:hypothetical protein
VQGRAAAEAVLVAIGEHHPSTLEGATRAILQAAARLGIVLGEHEVVLARARAAAKELDTRLASANTAGALRFLNHEFRRRRLEAERSGQRFMSYSEAQRRLKVALAGTAAGSPVELMRAVFDA